MHIILNNSSMVPIYEQLITQLRALVTCGELKAGDALPSVRSMAAELRISALTVKKAYDILEEEGVIVTVHGKGSFVAAVDSPSAKEARLAAAEARLSEAVDALKTAGLGNEEIRDLLEIILED